MKASFPTSASVTYFLLSCIKSNELEHKVTQQFFVFLLLSAEAHITFVLVLIERHA